MIFNFRKVQDDDIADTGTYADGVFDAPAVEAATPLRRLRGHIAHQRDYGQDRPIAPTAAGFA